MTLQRSISGGTFVTVQSSPLTTQLITESFSDPDPFIGTITTRTETGGGSTTYTDNNTSTGTFNYRLIVTGQSRWLSQGSITSQNTSIISIEE